MDNNIFSEGIKTEVECNDKCYNPYIKEPLFDIDNASFFLCRDGEPRKEVKSFSVVFRKKGEEEWEDDIMTGLIEAQALGSKGEEPYPVELFNLDVDVSSFVEIVKKNADGIVFSVNWDGTVEIPDAEQTDEGFLVKQDTLMRGGDMPMLLKQNDSDELITLHLTFPYLGLIIRDGNGDIVTGNLNIPFEEIMNYTYSFKGDKDDDRFAISFNNDKMIYHYVLTDNGKISIRDKRDRMAKIGETDCSGRLALLLQGIPNVIIKHKSQRWRINVVGD